MIHLIDIEKIFGPQTLFEGLSWHIKPGQRVGLVGPNGAGKSTLIKMIMGEVHPDGGEVRIARGTTLGYLPQEVATLAGTTVRDEARKGLERVLAVGQRVRDLEHAMAEAEGAELERLMGEYGVVQARFEQMGGFTVENRVEEILQGLGFRSEEFDRDCGTLSGGWQMRVVLARLLLQQPDVLLLDEPTNHLDLESVVWLETFLQGFPGSLVFISHDRWFLNRLSTHIAEMAAGELTVFTGNFDGYLEQAEQQRDLLERRAKNQARRVAELERFVARFRAKASKARQVQSRVKALEKMDRIETGRSERTIHFSLPEPQKSGRVVLELEDIRKAYGEHEVYAGLDCELLRGQSVALVGPNGAGKSTLLKLFAGVTAYQKGERRLGFQARLYYFAQHQVEVLDVRRTVLDEALADVEGLSPTKVRSVLGAFLFDETDCAKKVGVLSGGEKNRLALVKMLLTPANVLLLDEPTNHLDMASRAVLEQALAEYTGTVVLISHDRHFIDAVVDHVWEVRDGRVTPFVGTYTEYQARVARGDRPEPLPLHHEKRAQRKPRPQPVAAAAPKAAPKKPAPAPTIDWGGGDDDGVRRRKSKDQKRAEAEARKKLAEATRGLRQAAARAEARVTALEEELGALHAQQADPAHYGDAEQVTRVAKRVGEVEAELTAAYAAWEQSTAALEAAEAQD